MPARVVVLAGPSGAGKSRLAQRWGLPLLRLDDFYRCGDDPLLPRIAEGPNAGLVDWDHPGSWCRDEALTALSRLCRDGSVDVPLYSIADSARTGTQHLDLLGSDLLVAEGIFAPEVVGALRDSDLLAAAYCLRQHRLVTFWRRLTRDLREHRKPPLVLVRRGLALLRDQRRIVEHATALGCTPATPDEADAALRTLRRRDAATDAATDPATDQEPVLRAAARAGLRQPDQRTCGSAVLVLSRMLDDPAYASWLLADGDSAAQQRFAQECLATHRRTNAAVDRTGRLQMPWPRSLGTQPWALARALSGDRVVTRVHPHSRRRGRAHARIVAAVGAGHAVPLYVGNRIRPGHVVLVTDAAPDGTLSIHDPAPGRATRVTREDFVRGRLGVSGWDEPWLVVMPR